MNNLVTIEFTLPLKDEIKINVFDILGSQISTTYDGKVIGGKKYNITYNTEELKAGIYFLKLSAEKEIYLQKIIVVK